MITKHDGDESYAKWDSGSDERLKEDIRSLSYEEASTIIKNFEPLTFRYKKDRNHIKHYGFTAQKIEGYCDVFDLEDPFVLPLGKEDLKTVDYDQFIAPIMRVLQEQQKQIEELQNKK